MDISLEEQYTKSVFQHSKDQLPDLQNSHIRVRGLNVRIKNQLILKNINLDIPNKAITCIIGPSGCGKSTLLRTFNRLNDVGGDYFIDGQVLVDGENIHSFGADVISLRKKMGLLSQRPCPLPMSIYDNIAYGPRIHGMRDKSSFLRL